MLRALTTIIALSVIGIAAASYIGSKRSVAETARLDAVIERACIQTYPGQDRLWCAGPAEHAAYVPPKP